VRKRGSIYRKYVLLVGALVGGALIVSGAASMYRSYVENRTAQLAVEREHAVSASIKIENFVEDIERQIGWTSFPQVSTSGDPLEARRLDHVKLQRQVKEITESVFIDKQGREQVRESRLETSSYGSGKDMRDDPGFKVASQGKAYYGSVYFRKETEPYMAIAVPAGWGGGVTMVQVNLKFMWEVVRNIRVGKTGFAYVVDQQGRLIAHPDISLVLQKTDLSAQPQVRAALASKGAAGTDLERVSEGRDLSGKPVLTAFARIESLGWTVFVEQSIEEAYAPLYASLLRTGGLLVAGLLLAMVAGLVFARRMVEPIRILQEGADAFGAGDLSKRIDVRTGDELESLGERFNEMAGKLAASYAGLERKVEERTQELRQALEQQQASAEVLGVISSSVADTQPVFDKVTESCRRLFHGLNVGINIVGDDGQIHLATFSGPGRATLESVFPVPLSPESGSGAAILQRQVLHYPDVEADDVPDFAKRGARAGGNKALIFAPILWEGAGIGAIHVGRAEAGPFSDKEKALLRTFADQAAIAIQNSRLFHEIEDKSRQLEIANKHKSDFLANMSHELRTPLNAIIGFSEVLSDQMFGELNEKQLDYLKDIHASGKHLLSLINDILDLSKIEAGRMELDLTDVSVPDTLSSAMTLVRERAQNHGIELSLEVDPKLNTVQADERKMKQVVLNLLSNAVKFTPDGGRIGVRATLDTDHVAVAVQDSGIGIAPEDHDAVFEEFKQVGRDYTKKAEGTGLGLALTRRIVELHGGRIWVESAPGKGSTFTFTLPLTQAKEAA